MGDSSRKRVENNHAQARSGSMNMEIVPIIVGAIVIFLIGRALLKGNKSETTRYTDDQLKNMSDDEWEVIAKKGFQNTDTPVLKVYAKQYTDLRQRIESGHEQTLGILDEQGRRRSLRSEELVADELARRGVKRRGE